MNKEEYISEIDDIMEDVKSRVFIVTIKKIKKLEFNKGIILGLDLQDKSGKILGIFIANKCDEDLKKIKIFAINKEYKVKGNVFFITKDKMKDLLASDKEVINKLKIKENDKILAIRNIEELSKK